MLILKPCSTFPAPQPWLQPGSWKLRKFVLRWGLQTKCVGWGVWAWGWGGGGWWIEFQNLSLSPSMLCHCNKSDNDLVPLVVHTETEILSFWWNFNHWLHRKLSFWQLSVQPVMKISSKWRHFCFSVGGAVLWCYVDSICTVAEGRIIADTHWVSPFPLDKDLLLGDRRKVQIFIFKVYWP